MNTFNKMQSRIRLLKDYRYTNNKAMQQEQTELLSLLPFFYKNVFISISILFRHLSTKIPDVLMSCEKVNAFLLYMGFVKFSLALPLPICFRTLFTSVCRKKKKKALVIKNMLIFINEFVKVSVRYWIPGNCFFLPSKYITPPLARIQ